MKLLRFGPIGRERPGLLDAQGVVRDLGGVIDDLDPTTITLERLAALRDLAPETLPAAPSDVRLGPCVARPGKFICIGLNYACLLYTSPSPRDGLLSRMPSSA